jgi:hypothetical protein
LIARKTGVWGQIQGVAVLESHTLGSRILRLFPQVLPDT